MPQPPQSDSSAEESPRARSITEVLCREVGASHPDGALKQIRTMKRLLRSHYRVQQRLEQYDVDSLDEAVSRIATLTQQVEDLRTEHRQRARRRLTIIESLLKQMEVLRARMAPAPSESDAAPLQNALDLVNALATELDELRLELWVYRSDDPTTTDSSTGSTADELLSRLNEALREAQETAARLHEERTALRAEKDRLHQETERLRQTVEQQQRRIEELEAERNPSPLTPTDR